MSHSLAHIPLLSEEIIEDEECRCTGISLLDPKVCSAILCNYSKLKQASWDVFDGDTWYLMYDFDNLLEKTLKENPVYEMIVEEKIDGK